MIFEVAGVMALGAVLIFIKLPVALKSTLMEYPLLTDVGVTWAIYSMHDAGVLGTIAAAVSGAIFAGWLGVYTVYFNAVGKK